MIGRILIHPELVNFLMERAVKRTVKDVILHTGVCMLDSRYGIKLVFGLLMNEKEDILSQIFLKHKHYCVSMFPLTVISGLSIGLIQ